MQAYPSLYLMGSRVVLENFLYKSNLWRTHWQLYSIIYIPSKNYQKWHKHNKFSILFYNLLRWHIVIRTTLFFHIFPWDQLNLYHFYYTPIIIYRINNYEICWAIIDYTYWKTAILDIMKSEIKWFLSQHMTDMVGSITIIIFFIIKKQKWSSKKKEAEMKIQNIWKKRRRNRILIFFLI